MNTFEKKNIDDLFPLTPMQAGMLFHHLRDPERDLYFEQLCLRIYGEIDCGLFEQAWSAVIDTNEMLRTVFRWEKVKEPVQVVLKESDFKPRYYDLTHPVPSLEEIRDRDRQERFDLERVPFRVTVCKVAEDGWAMIVSHHHILYDGWSSGIILKEFFTAYRALAEGRQLTGPPKTGFKEFVKWLRQRGTDRDREFWQDYLRDLDIPPVVPARGGEPAAVTDTAVWRQRLIAETNRQLRSFVERHRLTLSALIYGAWGVVLQRYHDRQDIVYDTTVSGRSAEVKGIEDMVGLFINTVPFRLKAAAPETAAGLIARIDGELRRRQLFENSLPLDIKEYLEAYNRGLLFSSLLVVENYPLDKELKQYGDLTVFEQTGYDLTAIITAFDGDIELHLTYNRQLFGLESAAALAGHFVRVLQNMVENPGGRVGDIDIAAARERAKIFNNSGSTVRSRHEYRPPRDEVEEKLAGVWASLLKVERERLGLDSSFFEFGGHSLKASLLTVRIFKEFAVKVPLAEVFKRPCLTELAGYIKIQMKKGAAAETAAVPAAEKREYYDLSLAQQRLYVQQKLSPGTTILNMPVLLHLKGEIDTDRLANTFKKLIERHESLRTSFAEVAGTPVQRVHAFREIGERGFEIGDVIGPALFVRPFDLSRPPLLRVGIIRQLPGLLVDVHHLVSDGASQQLLVHEFTALYAGKELPRPRLQYKDFTRWQQRQVHTEEMRVHEQYWRHRLRAPLPEVDLFPDFPAPAGQDFAGDTLRTTLGRDLSRRLAVFLGQTGTTLYMVLLTVFNVWLNRYSGQQDIIIGSPTAGRNHPQLEPVVGLLMGTIMMRHFPHEGKTFLGFLEEVRQGTLEAYEHQVYPYEELARRPEGGDSPTPQPWNPITTLGLNVQNMFDPASLSEGGLLSPEWGAYVPDTSKLDLTVTAVEWQQDVLLEFEYRTALFKPETVARLAARFLQVLREAVENPGLHLWEIDMIPEAEKQAVIGRPERCYPLTHAQKRIYYTEQTYPGSSCNALVFTVRYSEVLDRARLAAAIHTVISRHEGLRLRIVKFPSTVEPCQYVAPLPELALDELDFSTEGGPPFALTNVPLFYFAYVRFNRQESGYVVKLHHLIADGWTLYMLFDQIDALYRELKQGRPAVEAAFPSYLEYLSDERDYLKSPTAERDREFWHQILLPLPEEVCLSTKGRRLVDIKSGISQFVLPPGLLVRLETYCYRSEIKISVYKVLFSVLAVYIARVTGLKDFMIGSANHGRTGERQKRMAGMFVSTLPIRVNADENISFQALAALNAKAIDHIIKNHQRYPFDRLAAEIRKATGIDLNYLLNINLIDHGRIRDREFRTEYHFSGYEETNLAIHIFYKAEHHILEWQWLYQLALFSPADIERMYRGLVHLLQDALDRPDRPVWELELLSAEEKRQILTDFNAAAVDYPEDTILDQMFFRQVEKTPDRIAVIGPGPDNRLEGDDQQLTYRELDVESDRLAALLTDRGVVPGTIVAIRMVPSTAMIVAILGILKSGAAYLPIGADTPQERVAYMLADSGAEMLLTSGHMAAGGGAARQPLSRGELAYVIYTSGSTGRPKGVLVSHGNVVAYLAAFSREFDIGPDDTVIQQASCAFDAFVEEMYPVLFRGGRLAIAGRGTVRDIELLRRFIRRHRVTMITCSPLLLNELNRLAVDWGIRIFISGGDVLQADYIDRLVRRAEVYNTYGPTEATVCATYYNCRPESQETDVPIGQPIANYRVFITDRHQHLLPVGAAGELCIAGPGVARGYLNNPELTAAKFVENPNIPLFQHSIIPGFKRSGRLYRTGDRCRWLADGTIEFLGRLDQQVKIRGFRIEPGEIEAQLRRHEDILDAAVIDRRDESGDRYLTAYIVPLPTSPTNRTSQTNKFREYLSRTLPAYMIPSYFIQLTKMPLTAGGKIDRQALPEIEFKTAEHDATPNDETERKLLEIWTQILGRESIGINSNFFELGGHSLRATRLILMIQKELDVKLPLAEIFLNPTIKGLSGVIRQRAAEKYAAIEPAEEKEYYELSPAQRRLFLLQQMDPTITSYNLPNVFELAGPLDTVRLETGFRRLIHCHESLRTAFALIGSLPVQRVLQEPEFKIEYTDLTVEELIRQFIRPFDLAKAPLLRVGLVKAGEQRHILMVDMHHIVTDGTSMDIMVREFLALYEGREPASSKIRYRDYAAWQKRESAAFKQQAAYWLNQFAEEIPVLNLPVDYPRPPVQSFEGSRLYFEIGEPDTAALKSLALQEEVTLFMLLLAIYTVWLSRLCGQEHVVVGTPVAGRRHADLQPIIGMFVNTLALSNKPVGDKSFRQFVREVKERTLASFENQEYPFENLVEEVSVTRDAGRNPLFDVMFALQNMETSEVAIPGLTLRPIEFDQRTSKVDLTVIGMEAGNELRFSVEYSTALFREETVLRFIAYFQHTVSSILTDKEQKILEISMIPQAEKERLRQDVNDVRTGYPLDRTIHARFEEQVKRTPGRIAVTGGMQLTYRELNSRASRLGHLLRERGAGTDTIAAIMVERSVDMMIGLWGILKSGAAYLPIDPLYPEERIGYMLADSGAALLLTTEPTERRGADVILMTESLYSNPLLRGVARCQRDGVCHFSTGVARQHTDPGMLAYVIYTSGTTGKPKGNLTSHGNVLRVVRDTNYIDLTENDRLLQLSNYAFDGSVFDIYGALLNGAALVLVDRDHVLAVDRLAGLIKQEQITVFFVTTALFNALVDMEPGCFDDVRKVLFGGERVSVDHVGRALAVLGRGRLIHVYGPTETTVYATYYEVDHVDDRQGTVPIGLPITHTTALILDRYLQLVPIGLTGELYIGGRGLARGYLNNPELTADKFMNFNCAAKPRQGTRSPNIPLFQHSIISEFKRSGRLYRTGDLARRLPTGHIEFVGRIDSQVKIRGFRVELGEIESRLLAHHQIKEALVTARDLAKGNTQLVAYIVPNRTSETNETSTLKLRQYLSRTLPDYMIPAYFLELDHLPLNPSGKVDQKSLPGPEAFKAYAGHNYAAPATDMEKRLTAIWKEVLTLEKVGVDDNFFDIGGNSLNILQVNQRLNKVLESPLPVMTMFRYTTIRSLSQFLMEQESQDTLDRQSRRQALNRGKGDIRQRYQKRKQQTRKRVEAVG